MSSELTAAALKLAVETTTNALVVEQENEKLKTELQKNLEKIMELDAALPRAQLLQQQYREKEAELEQKRKDLIEVQAAIIATLKAQGQEPEQAPQQSLESIPIVMNRVQKFVTDLTDAAVDQRSISIPILSLFKVTESLGKLYDALVDTNIIEETPEEKQERVQAYVLSQQEILTELRKVVQKAQSVTEEEEEMELPEEATEDVDPFAEPTPEEEAAKAEAEAAVPKKEEKVKPVGKSTLVLQIKPADTEIDLDALEAKIRAIEIDGLLWGKSERQEMCFGLVAINMGAVVTDDVSIDDLQETIESWDEEVASTEILAFQKI